VFDFLGAGLGTIIGTLSGIAAAAFLHMLFPQVADILYLEAVLVALGFIIGVWFDARSQRD
jgi:TctA family transporter